MKRRFGLVGIILFVLLIWTACDGTFDTTKSDFQLKYLSFTDRGCAEDGRAETTNWNAVYLSKQRVTGDTLILTLRFWSDCCSTFGGDVSIHDEVVHLSVSITNPSIIICDCTCQRDNEFKFLFSGSGTLRVRFGWMDYPFELDTLICVP